MILQILSLMIAIHANAQDVDFSGSPAISLRNSVSGIVASSLDKYQPPPWIDPFSSGTYSPSKTPFFNWDSLMTSGNIGEIMHGTGLIPTVQFGEGISVDSVRVVEDAALDPRANGERTHNQVRTVRKVEGSVQPSLKPLVSDAPAQIRASSSDLQILSPSKKTSDPLGISRLESNFGIDPSLLSLDNPATLDPSLLSPDNPAHADLIDFIITKDMALGTDGTVVHAPSFEPDPFGTHQPSQEATPEVVLQDNTPPDATVVVDNATSDSLPTGNKTDKTNKKQVKQDKKEKRLQKKQQRQERIQIRQQNKQKRKEKLQRQEVKQQKKSPGTQTVFSNKLAAQKQRRQEKIEKKIEQQLKKLEALNQENTTVKSIVQEVNNSTTDNQAFIVEENNVEQNTLHGKPDNNKSNKDNDKKIKNNKKNRPAKNKRGKAGNKKFLNIKKNG